MAIRCKGGIWTSSGSGKTGVSNNVPSSFWDPAHLHASPGSGCSGLWKNTTANWWVIGYTDATRFIINQQTNAIWLTSSANQSSQGQSVTLTAAIQVNGLRKSDATGNVVFTGDTVPMVTNVLAGGQAA
jgi:hypothetical protein